MRPPSVLCQARCLEASRADLRMTRVSSAGLASPGDGEVLFAVERFGLSANNITYALLGDELGYWALFPAEPGWGRIPAWGYLRVCASAVPGIEPGRRAFGLCPMATHVVLRPDRADGPAFTEGSPHRARLSSVYNAYAWADAGDQGRATASDDALVILQPVFWLSFTLDDYLTRHVPPGIGIILTSASSKAAIGLAHLLGRRGVRVTGLTSSGHARFTRSLSLYDRVLRYDRLEHLPAGDAVLVDIAGGPRLRDQVKQHLAGALSRVVVAGATHHRAGWLATGQATDRTTLFFAPDRIRELARQQGWPALERRFQASLGQFAASATWLKITRHQDLGSAARVYQEILANASSPAHAHIINPAGKR